MTWITPKTDWHAEYDASGLFIGDFINAADYNRIKNNLLFLRELALTIYPRVPPLTVGADKPTDGSAYIYAREFNEIETALKTLAESTLPFDFGEYQTFYDNGRVIGFEELNRIESAELTMYRTLNSSIDGLRRLPFRLGVPSYFLVD